MNVLICLPVMLYLVLRMGRGGIRVAFTVIAASCVAVLVAYIAAYCSWSDGGVLSLDGFVKYCLAYTYHPNPDWGTFSHCGRSGVKTLLRNQLWSMAALPRDVIPRQEAVVGMLLILLGGWHAVHICARRSLLAIRAYLLVWLVVYLVFFLWWLPSYQHLFVITAFPLSVLLFLAIADVAAVLPFKLRRPVEASAVAVLLVGFLFVNGRSAYARHHDPDPQRTTAAALVECGARCEDVVLCDRKTGLWLKYAFGFDENHALDVDFAVLSLYRNIPLGAEYRLREDVAIWIPVNMISPEFGRYGSNGYSSPESWLRVLHWILAFGLNQEGAIATCRDFRAAVDRSGRAYIHCFPTRRTVLGLRNLCEMLDDATANVPGTDSMPFLSWYGKAGNGRELSFLDIDIHNSKP
ncbi:MAG: hypothetical protein HN341_03270 [Verrucomicrobia bacterium]|nr:hypothetical protein [Verrucomicrobiota bacterium]